MKLRAEAGMSLIEALVAAIVLAVGVLGSAAAFTGSDKATLDSEFQQVATDQALLELERIRALDYAEIGHSAGGAPSVPAGQTAPSATSYAAPGAAGAEQLVNAANLEPGESADSFRISPAAQSRTFSVPASAGGPPITGHVYTLVTWRDEECEPVQISPARSAITALGTELAARQAQLGALGSDLLGTPDALLPPAARDLRDPGYEVAGIPANIPALLDLIDALRTRIADLEATLGGLTDADLCDLKLSQLASLFEVLEADGDGALNVKAAISGPIDASSNLAVRTAELQSALTGLGSVSCTMLPGSPACTTLNAAAGNLSGTIGGNAGVHVSLTDLDSNLAALDISMAGVRNSTHNTKRVTVIVTVDRVRSDQTPANPVYMGTVVTDPEDGLVLAS